MGAVKQYVPGFLRFYALGTVSTGDNKWKTVAPYDGEILEFGGYIRTLGSGAGTSTDVQIRNATTTPDRDYFSTKPTFEVDSTTNLLEGGELITTPLFHERDTLCLDIDAISTNPADVEVWVFCSFFKEVEL